MATKVTKKSRTGRGAKATAATTLAGHVATRRLMMTPQPDRHLFVNTPFETSVYFIDANKTPISTNMPLNVTLVYADDKTPVPATGAQTLVIDARTPAVVGATGTCKLKVAVQEVSMSHGNKAFRLRVEPATSQAGVETIYSDPLTVIRAKLKVQSTLPEKWYKDEGGRDKCMEVQVKLLDNLGRPMKTRKVPLHVVLQYEDGLVVTKQSILKLAPDSQLRVDSNGSALIRARIEDVSKNHQGQKFRLSVQPDVAKEPLTHDIAADTTNCVTVRSKRNKRQRGAKRGARNAAGAPGASVRRAGFGDAMAQSLMSLTQDTGEPTTNADALNKVIQWSNMTVHALQSLEWQTVGFELKPDGTNDSNRPILRCPGCWTYADTLTLPNRQHSDNCVLSNALQAYATDALRGLHCLVKEIHGDEVYERAKAAAGKPGGAGAGAGAGAAAAPPSRSKKRARDDRTNVGAAAPSAAAAAAAVAGPSRSGAGAGAGAGGVSAGMGAGMVFSGTGGGGDLLHSDGEDDAAMVGKPPELLRGFSDVVSAQPPLSTGMSLGLGPPGFNRMATSDWLKELGADMALGEGKVAAHPEEARVSHLLARGFPVGGAGSGDGFPAFTATNELIGFYVMSEATAGHASQMRFVPLAVLTDLPATSRDAAAREFADRKRANDKTVLKNIVDFDSPALMAESAMFRSWGAAGM